jgi:alkylation response protein AidB-like acyl-CoA dehydrogenase
MKIVAADSAQRLRETAIDLLGTKELAFEAGYELRQEISSHDSAEAIAKYHFLRSRANSIEGRTTEVMKNILGERMLGLPGEPRVDKDGRPRPRFRAAFYPASARPSRVLRRWAMK